MTLTRRSLLAAPLVLALAGPAMAHSWYSAGCCSDRDCMPIPAEAVSFDRDTLTYTVTLTPETHFMVTEPKTWVVPRHRLRQSEDGAWHACVLPGSQTLQCLYQPGGGV